MKTRWFAFTLLAVVLTTLASSVPAHAQLPVVGYRIHTIDGPSGRDVTVDAVYGVPASVDVTGDRLPDLLVELIGVGVPQEVVDVPVVGVLEIRKLTHPLKALVEVLITPPLSSTTAIVGYDGRKHGVPMDFRAVASLSDSLIDVDTDIAGAAETLSLKGALMKTADSTTMSVVLGPVPTSLDFDVITRPNLTSANLYSSGAPPRAEVAVRRVKDGTSFSLDAVIDKVPSRVGLEVRKDPLVIDRGLGAPPLIAVRNTVHYTANSTIALVRAAAVERPAISATSEPETTAAYVQLENVEATDVLVVADKIPVSGGKHRYSVTTTLNRPIGRAILGFSGGSRGDLRTGSVALLPRTNTQEYLRVIDQPSYLSIAAQIRGLTLAEFDSGDPLRLRLVHTASPLELQIQKDRMQATGWVRNLPSDVTLTYSPRRNRMTYLGSGDIGEIAATAIDPSGLIGRMTNARLLIRQVPRQLELVTDLDGAGLTVNVPGSGSPQYIGLVEVSMWKDSEERSLPADSDGAIIHEVIRGRGIGAVLLGEAAPERVFARVTGLHHLHIAKSKSCEDGLTKTFHDPILVDGVPKDLVSQATFERCTTATQATIITRGGRKLAVVTRTEAAAPFTNKFEYTFAKIDNLAPQLAITLIAEKDRGRHRGTNTDGTNYDVEYRRDRSRINYSAARASDRLEYETNTGDRYVLKVQMNPLPASFEYCKAARDGECIGNMAPVGGGDWSKGSLYFDSRGTYVDLNLWDSSTLDQEDRTSADVHLRHVAYAFLTERSGNGEIYLDTNTIGSSGALVVNTLSGEIEIFKDHERQLQATLDPRFHAEERRVRWRTDFSVPRVTYEDKDINCEGTTSFVGPLGYPLTRVFCTGIRV